MAGFAALVDRDRHPALRQPPTDGEADGAAADDGDGSGRGIMGGLVADGRLPSLA